MWFSRYDHKLIAQKVYAQVKSVSTFYLSVNCMRWQVQRETIKKTNEFSGFRLWKESRWNYSAANMSYFTHLSDLCRHFMSNFVEWCHNLMNGWHLLNLNCRSSRCQTWLKSTIHSNQKKKYSIWACFNWVPFASGDRDSMRIQPFVRAVAGQLNFNVPHLIAICGSWLLAIIQNTWGEFSIPIMAPNIDFRWISRSPKMS